MFWLTREYTKLNSFFTDILLNHISNILKQLTDKWLIVYINPKTRKGRIYRLNVYGEDMFKNSFITKVKFSKYKLFSPYTLIILQ